LFKVQQKLSATLGRLVGEMPLPQLRHITEFLCWRHTPPLLLLAQKALVLLHRKWQPKVPLAF
jgi:hypothetical protein